MSGYDKPDKEQHNPVSGTTPGDPKSGKRRWPVPSGEAKSDPEDMDMTRPEGADPVEDAGSESRQPADSNEIADDRARVVEE